MAKNTTQTILVGIGALVVGYIAYGEYKKYALKKLMQDAAMGKPGSAIKVLESLSTNSPTQGSGAKTVVVPIGPTPCDPNDDFDWGCW